MQDVRTNRFMIMIGVVSVFVLFWRCIPVVSKTLKSKYGASAKFMFSRETCFSVPGWLALEFSTCFVGKDQ